MNLIEKNKTIETAFKALEILKEENFQPITDLSSLPEWLKISVFESAAESYMYLHSFRNYEDETPGKDIKDHIFNYKVLSEVLKRILSKEGYEGFLAQCDLEITYVYWEQLIH